jgi:hypothetical protein
MLAPNFASSKAAPQPRSADALAMITFILLTQARLSTCFGESVGALERGSGVRRSVQCRVSDRLEGGTCVR